MFEMFRPGDTSGVADNIATTAEIHLMPCTLFMCSARSRFVITVSVNTLEVDSIKVPVLRKYCTTVNGYARP